MVNNQQPIMLEKNRGYTLIEMMFVIAILALISLYGFSSLRSQQKKQSIQLTVADLSTWVAAIENYKITQTAGWPTTLQAVIDSKLMVSDALCSHWPGSDTANQTAPCSGKNLYQIAMPEQGTTAPNIAAFWGVKIAIPDTNTADSIASQIPEAQIINSDTDGLIYVATYVSVPAALSNISGATHTISTSEVSQSGFISSGGVVEASSDSSDGQKIYLPNCPNGFEGHYLQFFANQRTGPLQYNGVSIFGTSVDDDEGHFNLYYTSEGYASSCNDSGVCSDESNAIVDPTTNPYIKLKSTEFFDGEGDTTSGNKYNFYITFCIPCGSWQDLSANATQTNNDGNDSWQSYLQKSCPGYY